MRIILFLFSFVVLLFGVALIGPSFVDWNKYKTQIVEQVTKVSGLEMKVNGDLSVSVLPSPRIKIEDLVIVSPKKVQFENLVTLKSAEVSVSLLPLLQKKIEISSVTLDEPDIQIEIMKDGTPSWTTDKIDTAKDVVGITSEGVKEEVNKASSNAMDSIALNELKINGGKVSFINHSTGAKYNAQDINLELEADSLNGPFDGEGSATYDGKKVTFDVETGALPKGDDALKLSLEAALPEAGASFSFSGLAAIKAPYDAQGQTNINVKSPQKLAQLFGTGTSFDQAISLNGLLSADENKIQYNDFKLSLDDFVGSGKITIDNLKSKNPVSIKGDIKSSSILELDALMPKNTKTINKSSTSSSKVSVKSKSLVPQTLALPMDINADVQLDIAGVTFQGQKIKGAFIDLDKSGATTKIGFKALELPGQSKANGSVNVAFASSSKSPKTGQVIYSDPNVSYSVNGQVGQLATFLKAFAPQADTSAVTKLYKTAQFDLNGKVNGNTVSLKDSTLKLDQMVIGLGGRYELPANGVRAKVFIDVSAGDVDFDKMIAAKGGTKQSSSNDNAGASKSSPKEALKPLQGFSLPLDLGFDISLQKARINNADLNGLRLTGSLTGKQLKLTNASVNDYAGATINLKGQVANLSDLTGLDLTLYTKTADIQKLASALKVDTSKLPKELKALEANVSGKGTVESLGFNANVKAMSGQLDVSGNAADLLGAPSYNNLSIGLSHPNLVKAIQVVSPRFKGQAGLSQPINFRSNASIDGKKIDLKNMVVKLGKSDFDGNLKIDASGKIMSVRGNIQAGALALDDLLGAKQSSSAKSSSGGSASASSASSSGRWSKTPIDLSFMNTVDVDVALSASALSYGAWNFTKAETSVKIGNGQMSVKDMKAGIFGGSATLSTEVKASPVRVDISTAMNNIDLEKLAKALSGSGKLKSSGSVSFELSAKSAGSSAHALINALNGKANLDGTDVTLKGFDLSKLARGLATEEKLAVSAMSLVDGAMSGGQTKFDTVKGDYKITNGVVNITSMVMDSGDAVIKSTGTADLPKWFINVDNEITLKSVPDLKPFEVKIKGPLDKPGNTFGKNILEDYLGDKIKRKLAKELPDVLGSDVTDKLKKFGILPQDKAPVAPVTPATPIEGSVEPAPQPVAPAPVQPKKIEKTEDAINELLKGGTPEEALGNVLKGLF